MSNRDRILSLITANADLTDRQIREATGIEPHQQVNQICRRLEADGLIYRQRGPNGLIMNRAADELISSLRQADRRFARPDAEPPQSDPPPTFELSFDPSRTLFVIPCSKSKRPGGLSVARTPDIFAHLGPSTGEWLARARSSNASEAMLDESELAPAWQRYGGFLYDRGSHALKLGVGRRLHIAIMSGQYGLCLATDSIGTYEAVFRSAQWPNSVVENALSELASSLAVETVVGAFASTTAYRRVFSRVQWPPGAEVFLVTPIVSGGGAMRLVPASIGDLLEPLFDGCLPSGWRSSSGLGLRVDHLP